ncbi:potassium channel family protein [Aspergillus mulundensis]|uniref:Potassium channel domain-containing protein n=1 Tax=Aspergillus mulundensis TaxID=1810919 RepID=A0A3D8T4D1_9EURO|nr:hypothetical protein DSM5745_00701 [Aspergillus mulundensis]RDW93379.1 hypothetical protein DSM5745_00701 [Aspergillus mulundensis]
MEQATDDWHFAVTAVPLIAVVLAPLANLMSITASVTPWINTIDSNNMDADGVPVQIALSDPKWCIALKATALSCGVIGNVLLLCRVAGMLRYSISLPLVLCSSIVAWASLTSALIATHITHRPLPDNQLYAPSFWAAVIAAVLYFVLSLLVALHILACHLGAHHPATGALPQKQRALVLQAFAFVIWLAIGGVVFSQSIEISYADAVYFSTVTVLTIGLGDITPGSALGRGLVFPYAVVGIVLLGLVVASVYQHVREVHDREVVRRQGSQLRRAALERLQRTGAVAQCQSERTRQHPFKTRSWGPANHPASSASGSKTAAQSSLELQLDIDDEARFNAMRTVQQEAVSYRRWTGALWSILLFLLIWVLGAVVFWAAENNSNPKTLTYFETLYFGFVSLLTIGYGDIAPASNAGRQFFIVWALLSVPTMTTLITRMSSSAPHVSVKVKALVASVSARFRRRRGGALTPWKGVFGSAGNRISAPRIRLPPEESRGKDVCVEENGDNYPEGSNFPFSQHLATAISETMSDALNSQPRQYSYNEWVKYRGLIRALNPHKDAGEIIPILEVLAEAEPSTSSPDADWDWIGEDSPLLADKTEPQWVHEQLCEGLLLHTPRNAALGSRTNASRPQGSDNP